MCVLFNKRRWELVVVQSRPYVGLQTLLYYERRNLFSVESWVGTVILRVSVGCSLALRAAREHCHGCAVRLYLSSCGIFVRWLRGQWEGGLGHCVVVLHRWAYLCARAALGLVLEIRRVWPWLLAEPPL